jgi:hypothetical protein
MVRGEESRNCRWVGKKYNPTVSNLVAGFTVRQGCRVVVVVVVKEGDEMKAYLSHVGKPW